MWMVFVLSICCSFTFVMSLAFCLCWRRKQSHSELTYIDGLVIKKNPDENVNHLTSSDNIDGVTLQNGLDNKRATLTNNTRRSLPDIPSDQEIVEWKPSGNDNNSEYYASVEQYQETGNQNGNSGVSGVPRGNASISQHSSLSQADFSPYERVKYDKIKSQQEHPYAQLQPMNTTRLSTSDNSKEPATEAGPSQSLSERNSCVNIPAATAVAGGISANPELPYITSPVPQPNFSGDSQDSSKGYTSISVREPLSKLVAEIKETKKRELDPHYSTVSDDSDDVYTTIPDPNQIYTSESETYAKIPPAPIVVEVEINHNSSPEPTSNEPKPQTHSRQASSSSSVGNVGSPKPEKRQANSPLPPPPVVEPARNLDELYAKVQKNKTQRNVSNNNSSSEEEKPPITQPSEILEHNYETLRKLPQPNNSDPGYEVLEKKIETESDPNYEELNNRRIQEINEDVLLGYSLIKKRKKGESLYARMSGCSETDPNYESVESNDPNYESIVRKNEHGYESVSESTNSSGGDKIENPYEKLSSDDTDSIGYAKIQEKSGQSSVESENSNILDENVIFEV